MKFTILATLLVSTLGMAAAIPTPVNLASRDVFVPPVLYPKAGTIWKSGEYHSVTWNTTDHPVNITNKIGFILLRKGPLATPLILASKFDILDGKVGVKVPNVIEGNDYSIVLFGDSGNFSPQFTITGSGI